MKRPWLAGAWLAVLIALLAVRNLPWHLDDKDQAKQAFTSFEMVTMGHWWFQHTPTGDVATKPPLAGWISAGLYHAFGQHGWEVAWRLPGFCAALLLMLVLWRAGNRLAPACGMLAVSAFALNHFSQRLATLVRTDMLLTFFIFIAGWLVFEKVRAASPWTARERWLLFFAVLGSMLTKGPIAYAFLFPGLAAFAWMERRRGGPGHAWAGGWPWLAPLLLFALWIGIGVAQSDAFYSQVVEKEFLGRFTVGEKAVHHNQPVWFYLGHLLGKFAPWSALLLGLYALPRVRASLRADPARLWLLCWALGGLLFMSLVPSKRADRIFPVIPPLCLLVAATLAPHMTARFGRFTGAQFARAAAALALLITGAGAAWEIRDGMRTNQRGLVRFGEGVRQSVASAPERLAIVDVKDEGLLLYCQHAGFILDPDDVPKAWKAGTLDWVLVSPKTLARMKGALGPLEKAAEVPQIPTKFSGYVLLRRPPSASTPTAPPAN